MKSRVIPLILLCACPALAALANKTDVAHQHINSANNLLSKGDVEGAVSECREAVRLKPHLEECRLCISLALYRLGNRDYEKGETDKAIEEYREALRATPDEAYWHLGLAKALEKAGDLKGATNEYRTASKLSPQDDGIQLALGALLAPAQNAPSAETPRVGDFSAGAPAGDTEPIPVKWADPPYSEEARRSRRQGAITVAIVIDTEGNVSKAQVVKALGQGLDQNALETVRKWKFRPATRDGEPVAARLLVHFNFRLF